MKKNVSAMAIIASLTIILYSCGSLPPKTTDTQASAPEQYSDTELSRLFSATVQEHGEESGFLLLRSGEQALRQRLYLADMAEHSIDAQYYIWNSDKSGKLLMQRLLMAAERGVSIRLLLDDFSIGDRTEQLLALNSHPNIQLRVYNPFVIRSGVAKLFNFAFDFERLNRRMHNKTFTVDGTVAITGGRNIGDEYFDQNEHLNFNDTDLLSVGPVVGQVSEGFYHYWNSPWAVPIDQLVEPDTDQPARKQFDDLLQSDLTGPLQISLPTETDKLVSHFQKMDKELIWAPATFICDEPGTGDTDAYSDGPKRVARHLLQLAEDSQKEVLIESAYFVLNKEGIDLVDQLRSRGVRVLALTNSMASNDVLPNHASYAMVREEMLEHGIELYELRPDAKSCLELIGRHEYCDGDSFLGLHAKAAVFDRETVYVGSMNLNLRSAYLNTEAAMIIKSPIMANLLAGQIELNMSRENSWQVMIKEGEIQWVTDINGRLENSSHEPHTGWLERTKANMLTLIPGALYY